MPSKSETLQGTLSCTIDASPNPVDAGTELTITARVVCDPACDLTGDTLSIRDADGSEVTTITFTDFDDETFESAGTVTLVAPGSVGDYAWSGVIEAFIADDADFAAVSMPLTFTVKAHTTRINVWDIPPAIGLGERFAIKVGVKCTCGCTLGGQPFTVHDDAGAEIAAGVLGPDILPSTEALYFADAALIAPTRAPLGNHGWEVRFPAVNLSHPHAAATAQFGVTFVPAPEHTVTIEALDIVSKTPLAGAIVAMHPYRALTDERGVAELRVPKGAYTIFVSARKYVSDKADVTITGDLTTQAHLAVEVRPERL